MTAFGAALLALAASVSGGGNVIFADDFEAGEPLGWQELQRARPEAIRVVDGVARTGRRSVRVEVRHSDHVGGEAASRAELAGQGELVGPGDRRVYSWSTYVPDRYPYSRHWQVIAQWKNEGTGSPPVELDVHGDSFVLYALVRGRNKTLWRGPIGQGWTDFSVHMRYSESGRDTRIRLYRDGRLATDRRDVPNLFRGRRNYFKLGLYRSGRIRATGVVYHDAVRVRRP